MPKLSSYIKAFTQLIQQTFFGNTIGETTKMNPVFILLLLALGAQAQIGPFIPIGSWTKWYDRDDPSGSGDWEVLSALWPKPCGGNAYRMEVRVKGDPTVIASTTQRITLGPEYGLSCRKTTNNNCVDYSVQYLVPRISKKFDRDNPSGLGDFEIKSLETGSDWKDGRFIYWYGSGANYGLSDERLELGPKYGLLCKNSDQADKQCRDYEVRFQCPFIWKPLQFAIAPPKLPQPT